MTSRLSFGLLLLWFSFSALAASLSDIQIANGSDKATVTLSFSGQPVYGFFTEATPPRLVLDIRQSGMMQGLPLLFSGANIVKSIRAGQAKDNQSIRLLFELTKVGKSRAVTRHTGNNYKVILTIEAPARTMVQHIPPPRLNIPAAPQRRISTPLPEPATAGVSKTTSSIDNRIPALPAKQAGATSARVVVAIDAGHGGQDPGAIGPGGLKEKNVTIAIGRRLQQLLNQDPMFRGVLTRDGDYFISVMGRSDVARKQNANVLVSVHADAAPNRSARGASVWVLSNRRANSEMARWLEQHEKQSELLGGAGDLLGNQADPFLSQTVLDLQFGHSQRVGYDVAEKVIQQLRVVGALHKSLPQHASLGVLRSPDIPSLLVETGFISNPSEEQLLGSGAYQDKIATSIYQGLRYYFLAHPLQSLPDRGKRRGKNLINHP